MSRGRLGARGQLRAEPADLRTDAPVVRAAVHAENDSSEKPGVDTRGERHLGTGQRLCGRGNRLLLRSVERKGGDSLGGDDATAGVPRLQELGGDRRKKGESAAIDEKSQKARQKRVGPMPHRGNDVLLFVRADGGVVKNAGQIGLMREQIGGGGKGRGERSGAPLLLCDVEQGSRVAPRQR